MPLQTAAHLLFSTIQGQAHQNLSSLWQNIIRLCTHKCPLECDSECCLRQRIQGSEDIWARSQALVT
uniref:Uncharacterized protein n=1 Tax=Arundo donax TaxID=35708 RepID=A0A0A9CZ34_ARUDO